VRSREMRRREARSLITWVIGAIVALFVLLATVEYVQWRAVAGLTVAFLGASYLFIRELRPVFPAWQYALQHPEGSFAPVGLRTSRGERFLVRILARLGSRDIMQMNPGEPKEVWLKAAGFGAIALGTLVQIIEVWP
jgi:hypothetical protein